MSLSEQTDGELSDDMRRSILERSLGTRRKFGYLVDMLKEHTSEDSDHSVMVINPPIAEVQRPWQKDGSQSVGTMPLVAALGAMFCLFSQSSERGWFSREKSDLYVVIVS
jgi:hypothetical protein